MKQPVHKEGQAMPKNAPGLGDVIKPKSDAERLKGEKHPPCSHK